MKMSPKFKTRKRGTPKQIGKKFPVLQKKRLPSKISIPESMARKVNPRMERKLPTGQIVKYSAAHIAFIRDLENKTKKKFGRLPRMEDIDRGIISEDEYIKMIQYQTKLLDEMDRKSGGKYNPAYKWLEDDSEASKAVEALVAHSGFTETEKRLKMFIKDSGAKNVDAVFTKLLVKGIIQEVPSKSEWRYKVPVVTDVGRRKLHAGPLYGTLTSEEKRQVKKFKKEGLL